MTQVLICGAMVVTLSMGIRHGFGLWLQPITMDRGWTRETFALATRLRSWGETSDASGRSVAKAHSDAQSISRVSLAPRGR